MLRLRLGNDQPRRVVMNIGGEGWGERESIDEDSEAVAHVITYHDLMRLVSGLGAEMLSSRALKSPLLAYKSRPQPVIVSILKAQRNY